MFQRVLEILLLVVIAVGAVVYWRASSEREALQAEHKRLTTKVGELVITDPTKVHLRAIATGVPGSYAWRAYFPPKYKLHYQFKNGGGSSWRSEAWEGILRVRLRNVDGQLVLYTRCGGGSSMQTLGNNGTVDVGELLKTHPDLLEQLHVVQLAQDETVIFPADENRTLFTLSVPEQLLSPEKRAKRANVLEAVLEEFRLGPEKPSP